MKLKLIAHAMLIDCGKVSKATRGVRTGAIFEGGTPPWQWYV